MFSEITVGYFEKHITYKDSVSIKRGGF